MNNEIKISIVEDCEIQRECLKIKLRNNEKLSVVSADRFGREGIDSARLYKPHAMLVDFQLEDMTGLEVAKRVKRYDDKIKIFAFTAHTDTLIIARIIKDKNIDAIAIKGSYYFEANFFLAALDLVIKGEKYIDPLLLEKIRKALTADELNNLTNREFEILIQTMIGKSDVQIAKDLCIELPSMRNLKSRIAKKIKNKNVGNLLENFSKISTSE